MPDWCVSLSQHHEGYITVDDFFNNQERLQKNRTNGPDTMLSGPVREGLALSLLASGDPTGPATLTGKLGIASLSAALEACCWRSPSLPFFSSSTS